MKSYRICRHCQGINRKRLAETAPDNRAFESTIGIASAFVRPDENVFEARWLIFTGWRASQGGIEEGVFGSIREKFLKTDCRRKC
jgi:hypothetical protein